MVRLLNFQIPLIDPSLFIHRFIAQLEFEKEAHGVSITALKLLTQMKRDWMTIGRRPSGICGACILIAARMHGFKRSISDVAVVVRASEQTIRRRLAEFSETPSSKLTLEEFNTICMTSTLSSCDPPAYSYALKKSKTGESNIKKELVEDEYKEQVLQAENESKLEIIDASENKNKENKIKKEEELAYITNLADEKCLKEYLQVDGGSVKTMVELSLDDLDENEINSFILSDEQASFRERVWNSIHADYLEDQQLKEKYEVCSFFFFVFVLLIFVIFVILSSHFKKK